MRVHSTSEWFLTHKFVLSLVSHQNETIAIENTVSHLNFLPLLGVCMIDDSVLPNHFICMQEKIGPIE